MCSRLLKGIFLLGALGMALAVGAVLGGAAVYLVTQDDHPHPVVEVRAGSQWHDPRPVIPHRMPLFLWGTLVLDVERDSPASRAGLQEGDVIAVLDGAPVIDPGLLVTMIAEREPGDEIELTVYRLANQAKRTVVVTLGKHPKEEGMAYLGIWLDGNPVDLDSEFWRE